MANRNSRIVIPVYQPPSYDGRFYGRYPKGNKPNVGAALTGSAVDQAVAAAALSSAIRMGGAGFMTAAALAGLSTAIQLGASAADIVSMIGTLAGGDPFPPLTPTSSDLFFDPNGSGTDSGTDLNPYKTLPIARPRSLVPGQRLFLKNSTGSGAYNAIDWSSGMPAGTSTNPIEVCNYPGHVPLLWNCPTIGVIYALTWWNIRGIDIRSDRNGLRFGWNSWDGTGGVPDVTTSHVNVIDCLGTRSSFTTPDTDNSGLVTAGTGSGGSADYIGLYRNKFVGVGGNGSSNSSLIWFDRVAHLIVAGNDLDNADNPAYYKHNHNLTQAQVKVQVYNNIFRRGGTLRGVLWCCNFAEIFNNALEACTLNVSDDGGDGPTYNRTGTIIHNSFQNCPDGIQIYPSGTVTPDAWLVRSNVFGGTSRLQDNPDGDPSHSNKDLHTDTDFNAYGTGSGVIKRNSTGRSLATHKLAFPTQEQHSVAGAIALVNSTPGGTPSNWALQSGSAGRNAGHDGTDCGVDATKLLTAL